MSQHDVDWDVEHNIFWLNQNLQHYQKDVDIQHFEE
jgi:hypothetical protein